MSALPLPTPDTASAPSPRNCPACGTPLVRDRALPAVGDDRRRWPYWPCPACGLLELAPDTPNLREELARAYSPDYYGAGPDKFPAWLERWRRKGPRRLAGWVARQLPPAARVLDVGCGNGAFLAALGERGCEIHGIELPGPAFDRAARVPGIRLQTGELRRGSFAASSLDAVTLWHVLEHLPDPGTTLSCCAEFLRPDGLLFLEVPNVASWQARVCGRRWLHLDPPRHLHQFTAASLERLAGRAGLEIVQFDRFSLQMGGMGWLQGLLDFVVPDPHLLYRLLLSRGRCPASAVAKAASVLLAVPATPCAALLTLLEGAAGSGAVLRCQLRRRSAATHAARD